MSKKNLPIKLFEKRKEFDARKTEGGSGDLPSWANISMDELTRKASEFTSALSAVAQKLDARKTDRDFIPAVLKVEIIEQAIAKSHRPAIATLFNGDQELNLIGLSAEREIMIKVEDKESLERITKKLSQPGKYTKGIAAINEMGAFEPLVDVQENLSSAFRASLINFHNYNLNQAVARTFELLCRENKVEFRKAKYSHELIMYRLAGITSDSLNALKTFEALETLLPMPLYSLSYDSVSPLAAMELPIKYPIEGKSYPKVGVLDSGIEAIPHLKPWIMENKFSKVPTDRMNTQHGTFVSGILVYGDDLQNQNYTGVDGCYLFDAIVMPDINREPIEEADLIEHISEAIEKHYEEIKIWNLSLGTRKEAHSSLFSPFGKALDQLQEKYNVIICKSAGNCLNFQYGKPVSRIAESADSVRSLVVGSISQEKNTHDVSDVDHPSPFSRIGKGPAYINKPDLTHYGGNAGVNPATNKITISGVNSFHPNGSIAADSGTSFSTPRVTAIVAGLSHNVTEEYDPLLLKALALHSAKYPAVLTLPNAEKIKHMGFGVPGHIADTLFNDPNEITLILQDTLVKGEWIEIADFPFPQSMIENGFYYGEIIATVVSAPHLSESQGSEYCQSNLEIRLGTYDQLKNRQGPTIRNDIGLDNPKNILNDSFYAAAFRNGHSGAFATERTLIKFGDKYQPVKKYAVNLEEMTQANKRNYLTAPKKWYLQIEAFYRDFIVGRSTVDSFELSQDFCLIITIRDNKRKHGVYDQVTQYLNLNGFVHSNMNVRADVKISVDSK